jgi:hypothetical protein
MEAILPNFYACSIAKEEQMVGKSAVLSILRFPEQAKQMARQTHVSNQQLREQVIAGIEDILTTNNPHAGGNRMPAHAHITIAITQLESDMRAADLEMEEREDVLAARYLDLEQSSAEMNDALYERSLQMLEAERKQLEEDRIQLQEHFAMRLASIKSQHQEAALRSEALYLEQTKQHLQGQAQSPMPSSPSNAQSRGRSSPIPYSPKRSLVQTQADLAAVARAEKGWISSAIKATSHNTHLTKLQRESSAALKVGVRAITYFLYR